MNARSEAKGRTEGAREERANILNLITGEIEEYQQAGDDETKSITERFQNRMFAEILGELRTKIRFADFE